MTDTVTKEQMQAILDLADTSPSLVRLPPSTVRYITERAMMFDELVEGLQQIREMVDALGWSANTNTDHLTGPIDTLLTRAQSLNGGKNG